VKSSILLILVSVVCAFSVGCGERNRSTTPAAAGPGVVGQLTGDDDSEVDPQLQLLVADALTRGETDEPLEGF